jgi:hypothetical protein
VVEHEAMLLAKSYVRRLEEMDWSELLAFTAGGHEDHVTGASGAEYRLRAESSWDMEPWLSDLRIWVKVYPGRGRRRGIGYRATGMKRGEDLPPPPPGVIDRKR